jgi:lipopolysaccharide biosynthesis glycosyltransferase
MTPIVTVSDENYLPGLTALHNSFLRHSADGFEFWAIIRGSDEFVAHVKSLGINVIVEPYFPIDRFPTSKRYPEELPLFYWRLLVPTLFKQEYSFFIDCDALILQSLKPLLFGGTYGHPIAATRSNSSRGKEYGKAGSVEVDTPDFGPMSSLYLFNRKVWMQKRIWQNWIEAMKCTDMVFHTVAQGLLQYVLKDDWHMWPWSVQAHAGHKTMQQYPKEDIYTLHFMGTNPWCEFSDPSFVTNSKLKARELWQTYT